MEITLAPTTTYEHTISGLIRWRNELFSECETAAQRIARVKNDITAIDRVLQSLGFEGDINERMKKPYMLTSARRGDVIQTIKEELKKASQPMHSRELAKAVITMRGMDHRDRKYAENTRRAVSQRLRQMKASGLVKSVTDNRGEMRWVWAGVVSSSEST